VGEVEGFPPLPLFLAGPARENPSGGVKVHRQPASGKRLRGIASPKNNKKTKQQKIKIGKFNSRKRKREIFFNKKDLQKQKQEQQPKKEKKNYKRKTNLV
jgi:hypothetical protein